MPAGTHLYNWNHHHLSHDSLPTVAIDIANNNKYAITADTKSFVRWNIATGEPSAFWETQSDILTISISGNGNYALVGTKDQRISLIDFNQNASIATLPQRGKPNALALSKNGNLAVTATSTGTVQVWLLHPKIHLSKQWQQKNAIHHITLSNDATLMFTANNTGSGMIYDLNKLKVLFNLNNSQKMITASRFSANKNFLLVGNIAQEIMLWNIHKKQLTTTWHSPHKSVWRSINSPIQSVAFNQKLTHCLATLANGMTYSWLLNSNNLK